MPRPAFPRALRAVLVTLLFALPPATAEGTATREGRVEIVRFSIDLGAAGAAALTTHLTVTDPHDRLAFTISCPAAVASFTLVEAEVDDGTGGDAVFPNTHAATCATPSGWGPYGGAVVLSPGSYVVTFSAAGSGRVEMALSGVPA